MSRFIRKLSSKYDFLTLELEETEEKFDQYVKEWTGLFGKYLSQKEQVIYVNEETGEISNEIPDESKKDKEKPSSKIKRLFKKLSLKAHPDKGGSEEEFNKLQNYYSNNDLLGLLLASSDYDVEIEIDEEDEDLLEKSCNKLEEKIDSFQKTLAWAYFTGNKKTKLNIIKALEKDLKLEIDKSDYPEELLDLVK